MPHHQFSAYNDWFTYLSLAREVNQSYHRIFHIFKLENRSRTTCSRFLQPFASPLWHSSFHTKVGRTHCWWKPKERRCEGRTWNLFHIHQNCHLRWVKGMSCADFIQNAPNYLHLHESWPLAHKPRPGPRDPSHYSNATVLTPNACLLDTHHTHNTHTTTTTSTTWPHTQHEHKNRHNTLPHTHTHTSVKTGTTLIVVTLAVRHYAKYKRWNRRSTWRHTLRNYWENINYFSTTIMYVMC